MRPRGEEEQEHENKSVPTSDVDCAVVALGDNGSGMTLAFQLNAEKTNHQLNALELISVLLSSHSETHFGFVEM